MADAKLSPPAAGEAPRLWAEAEAKLCAGDRIHDSGPGELPASYPNRLARRHARLPLTNVEGP